MNKDINDKGFTKHVFPVNLMIEGKRVLVVGGGGVALRKTQLLLDAFAVVTVVSPDICPGLKELKDSGVISVIKRKFSDKDVERMFLAFAATNSREVNRSVLDVCNERGVLVCSVDEMWPEGDFITPAVLRKGGLLLTVSTGGLSCKRARRVKESLASNMNLLEGDE